MSSELTPRKKAILAAVVNEYITSAEPVGSKRVVEISNLNVSPATIRNELSDLTAMGYLEQPHTSAGRVPTALGYRFYVNELMQRHSLTDEEADEIDRSVAMHGRQSDELISDVGKMAAEMTNYPAVSMTAVAPATIERFDLIYIDANNFIIVALLSNRTVRNKLVHLPFSVQELTLRKLSTVFNVSFTGITDREITPALISGTERSCGDTLGLVAVISGFCIEILSEVQSSRAAVSGENKLLQIPEFRDPDKAHRVMNYLSDSSRLENLPGIDFGEDVKVLIGPENVAEELKNSSVILAKYNAGDGLQGVIGVVGPTRMDYARVAAKLSYMAGALSKALSGNADQSLPGFGKLMISSPGTQPPK